MGTTCYAMVRGSRVRVTALTACGSVTSPVRYTVTKGIATVEITDVTEGAGVETFRDDYDAIRAVFRTNAELIRYDLSIKFTRVDPGLFSLISGAVPVENAAGDIVGFDSIPTAATTSFGLEVWSQLAGNVCEDGQRKYGYTLFPFLRGGRLSGFAFSNGAVSFSLTGTRTVRRSGWDVGPHVIGTSAHAPWDVLGWDTTPWDGEAPGGPTSRLLEPIGSGTHFRQGIVDIAPPAETNGVETFLDIIDNGTPADPGTGILDGGTPVTVSPGIVSGNGP